MLQVSKTRETGKRDRKPYHFAPNYHQAKVSRKILAITYMLKNDGSHNK